MKRTLIEEMIIAAARAIVAVADADATTTTENNTTTKKTKAAKKAEPVEDDADDGTEVADVDQETGSLEEKTTKELYQMCVDAGIKVPKYGKNKQFYIAALNDAGIGDDAKAAEEAEDGGDQDEDKYAGKTAKELFELCKKRGIKAAPKKKAEFYIDLLKKADDAEGDEDDDDWGDEDDIEDEPAPAPKKTAATKKATTTKKQAKKAAPADDEDDDDDDWDI